MPCFNHARYVEESIKAVLNQTESNLELIVVDDGSSDGSPAIIERLRALDERVKPIYFEKNRGASEARNSALSVARSEYVAFCDADDIWLPEKLAKQIEALRENSEAAVAYSDALIVNSGGEKTGASFSDRFPVPGNGSGNVFPTLCTRNFINMQSALVRRDCIRLENYFDPKIRWVEDWLFWVKLARAYPLIYLLAARPLLGTKR
jgi:glycosyltransferase involved in cell wall biosynthesis